MSATQWTLHLVVSVLTLHKHVGEEENQLCSYFRDRIEKQHQESVNQRGGQDQRIHRESCQALSSLCCVQK